MRGCRGGVSPCAGLGGSPAFPHKPSEFPSRRRRPPALETADSGACKESRQRKRVKGRCPLRGCRGGVSPCTGLGGSPSATEKLNEKEKKKTRVSEQAPKAARVGNGRLDQLQGIAPAEKGKERHPPQRCRSSPAPRVESMPTRARPPSNTRKAPSRIRQPCLIREGVVCVSPCLCPAMPFPSQHAARQRCAS